jgi:hypothetical protein
MRLIDADALGVGRCSRDVLPADYCAGWNGLIRLLEKAPTVDAVPVVHGRWTHLGGDEWCGVRSVSGQAAILCATGV